MAEVYPDAEDSLHLLVVPEQNVIVRRHALPLMIPGFDAETRCGYFSQRQTENLFQKTDTQFPIRHHEEPSLSRFPRCDEVAFGMPHARSPVDICGPVVNERAVGERFSAGRCTASPLSHRAPVILNPPPVRTFDISVNTVFGYSGEGALPVLQASGNGARRLVIIQEFFHKRAEQSVLCDLHTLILRFFPPDVCFVMGFLRIIRSANPIPF